MKSVFSAILLGLVSIQPLAAQDTSVIDWSAEPVEFSEDAYDELLICTLSRHPEGTRDYSEYHLLRRNNQSVAENEADPASRLAMPIISDCYDFGNGGPIPFSLDRLIGDWGEAHEVFARNAAPDPMTFQNASELAECALTHQRALVDEMLALPRPMGGIRYAFRFIGPQCLPEGDSGNLDIDEFYAAIDAQLAAAEEAP